MSFENFRVTDLIGEGERGRARVDVIVADSLGALRASRHGARIREGDRITRLFVGGRLMMSDTRDEYRDHLEPIQKALGRVLIHGLGCGCYLKSILAKPEVEHVDVVELEPDVLALIGPYFADDTRVHFHEGDAYTFMFQKGKTWDVAWHDIWAEKSPDDLDGHSKMNRRYARKVGWQGCWGHRELLQQRRHRQRRSG